MPADIDRAQRKITQLQIEKQALKDGDDAYAVRRLAEVDKELAELEESNKVMRAQWLREKELIETIREKKRDVEQPEARPRARAAHHRLRGREPPAVRRDPGRRDGGEGRAAEARRAAVGGLVPQARR